VEIIHKLWGEEHVMVNEPEYCLKKLLLAPGHQSSLHYHRKKKETFFVEAGSCRLELHKKNGVQIHNLVEGRVVTITPGTPHRIYEASGLCILIEVSTHHDDLDVVRLEESQ
jgi:mannose-6-phosphate isomerase-like protein (cupin superfamily)